MIVFIKQEKLDREMAPVVGRCKCCDAEFYSRYEAEIHDGLCEECWRATRDLDEARDFYGRQCL